MAEVIHPVGVISGIPATELIDENCFNPNYVIEVKELIANAADNEFGAIINLYINYDYYDENGVLKSVKNLYGSIDELFVGD